MKKRKKIIIFSIILIGLIIISSVVSLLVSAEYLTGLFKSKVISSNVDDAPGVAPQNTYPVILLHGLHLTYNQRISEFTFKEMQETLAEDLGYLDRGILNPETSCAELRYSNKPIIIRTTYLEVFGVDSINDYSVTLDEIIKKVIYCTGAKKVDVIAHSMGGVVTRNYIKEIEGDSIRNLIMLGTPNNGGLYNIAKIADILSKDGESIIGLDFVQLAEDSNFMRELNSYDFSTHSINYITIAGIIDEKGDGIVTEDSVRMNISTHHKVECGHLEIKDPSRCPESYNIIKEILSK